MGREQTAHYQFYPFLNAGHFRFYDLVDGPFKKKLASYYRDGIERCLRQAERNPYRIGVPFIWCSNNLVVALATQCLFYEAMTGARSYQDPAMPEQACLVLARLAGTKLNTALVKAFINAVTFFPVGSMVRTSRDEMGVVVRTVPGEPLHPVVALMTPDRLPQPGGEIDTSRRETGGTYERHLVETLLPPDGFSVVDFLAQVH